MVLETIRRLAADRYACDEEAVVLAATFVLVNLAVDLIYALVDPRIKYD